MTDTAHADTHIVATVLEMQRRHPHRDPAEIERRVRAEYQAHQDDAVQGFVPILVTRAVENHLRRTPPGVVEVHPGGRTP